MAVNKLLIKYLLEYSKVELRHFKNKPNIFTFTKYLDPLKQLCRYFHNKIIFRYFCTLYILGII